MRVVRLNSILIHFITELLLASDHTGKVPDDNEKFGVLILTYGLELYLKILDLVLIHLSLLLR